MAGGMAISVFGTLQIVTLSNARVPYAMSRDGLFFRSLGTLSATTHVPVRAIAAQSAWAGILIVSGQAVAGLVLMVVGLPFYFYWSRELPAEATGSHT
jgi:amino acid transporter